MSVMRFSPTIRYNPIDGFQASLLIKLQKLDWGSILDNKGQKRQIAWACAFVSPLKVNGG